MNVPLGMLLIALVASLVPVQAVVNARLGQSVGNSFLAALISFLGGAITLLVITVVWAGVVPKSGFAFPKEWYLYTGGLLGIFFVTTVLTIVPVIGTANLLAASIVGQLVMSLVIDHWALMGMPRSPINGGKIVGVALLVLGTWLIQRK